MTRRFALLRPRRTATRLAATVVACLLSGALLGAGTWSSFNDLSSNSGNSFEAGTVAISDDDSGSAMFDGLGKLRPGGSIPRCIVVTYNGSLPASVRLHGTTGGSGLDPYLNVRVTRGTKSSAFSDCTGFTADAATYLAGKPAGVVYDGTLAGYPDSRASAILDPVAGSPETWSNGESHAYRFDVSLQNDGAAQGRTATQTFRWDAENE